MKALAIVLTLSFLNVAFASENRTGGPPEPSLIEGDHILRCSTNDPEVELAFNHESKRVWITSSGYTDGMEIDIQSYDLARCPGCYRITSSIWGDGSVILELSETLSSQGPVTILNMSGTSNTSNGKVRREDFSGICYQQSSTDS